MPKKNTEAQEGEIIEEKSINGNDRNHKKNGYIKKRWSGKMWLGVILVALGALILLEDVYGVDVWQYFWPALLIVVGLALLANSSKK